MSTLIVSASKDTSYKWYPSQQFRRERRKLCLNDKRSYCTYNNNTRGLATVYNEAVTCDHHGRVYDWIVFVHADAMIDTADLDLKLAELGEKYDVVGVAGTSKIQLKEPCLWHLMGQGSMHGAVAHTLPNEQKSMSYFGPYPSRAVLIDGVFMAVKTEVFKKVKFDENCPSKFHFYDLIFSMDCHNAGFRVGVGDIMVTHDSPGLREFTPDFLAGQEYFLQKYKPNA